MRSPVLVLGPVLRHVDTTSATLWIEADQRCTVEVAGCSARTFCVGGHHYALVAVTGLEPGTSTPYDVKLDGDVVWPLPDSAHPPSRIRTHLGDDGDAFRIVFGSCRHVVPLSPRQRRKLGGDALDAYAVRMAGLPEAEWADALLLLGDQVYADETSPATQEWLRRRRDTSSPPGLGVADFEEYTRLYSESWSDPDVRWLLSTVPTSMIFDDHDVHDDWNTSRAWRARMAAESWWSARIRGAIVAYWVYQHLGNLAPADLDSDDLFRRVQRLGGTGDALDVLREFAEHADAEADGAKSTRWSYRRDFGAIRLLVIDTRCGRILDGRRLMVSDEEFDWITESTRGDYAHLLIGSSLPWLLPGALHQVEAANEAACELPGWRGRLAERVRQGLDLEHWASFQQSFTRLAELVRHVARGAHTARPPSTISVLSGDVHHSYVARARFADEVDSRVWQLTCSPVHNVAPGPVRLAFRAAWSAVANRLCQRWAQRREVPSAAVSWERTAGPYFRNQVAVLTIDGANAEVAFEPAEREPVRVPLTGTGADVR
ncbi:MAG: alkaline phosphatase D family protein [Thermocrispum sp.]